MLSPCFSSVSTRSFRLYLINRLFEVTAGNDLPRRSRADVDVAHATAVMIITVLTVIVIISVTSLQRCIHEHENRARLFAETMTHRIADPNFRTRYSERKIGYTAK